MVAGEAQQVRQDVVEHVEMRLVDRDLLALHGETHLDAATPGHRLDQSRGGCERGACRLHQQAGQLRKHRTFGHQLLLATADRLGALGERHRRTAGGFLTAEQGAELAFDGDHRGLQVGDAVTTAPDLQIAEMGHAEVPRQFGIEGVGEPFHIGEAEGRAAAAQRPHSALQVGK